MSKSIPSVSSAPAPVGPYSVVTESNGFVFLSGQVGLAPESGAVVSGGVEAQARRVMENLGGILGDLGLGFDDVVKSTIFLTDMDHFAAVNAVYGEFVGQSPPARSTVAVAALPLGVSVEIDMIAAR